MTPSAVAGIRRACRRAARAAGVGDTDGVRAALEAAGAWLDEAPRPGADVLVWAAYMLSGGPVAPVELAAVAGCDVPLAEAALHAARGGR